MTTKKQFLNDTNRGLNFYLWAYEQQGYSLKVKGKRIKNTYNLFYRDGKPSVSIYYVDDKNQWCFKDHGNNNEDIDYSGDVFSFGSFLFDIPLKEFPKLLKKMDKSINDYKPSTDIKFNSSNHSPKKQLKKCFELIRKEIPSWEAIVYYNDYRINLYDYSNVYQITGIKYFNEFNEVSNTKMLPDNQIFIAYDMGNYAKIQNITNKQFWFEGSKTEEYIFGDYDFAEEVGERLYITGGEKDVMTLQSLGYKACCLQSETTLPSKDFFNALYEYKYDPVVLYDIDQTGITYANKINEQFGIPFIDLSSIIPKDCNIKPMKDISDYIKHKLGETKLKEFLKGLDIEQQNTLEEDFQHSEHLQPIYKGIDNNVFEQLPSLLRNICKPMDELHERDILLLGALVLLSNIISVKGVYYSREIYPNLYFFVTAKPASGKSVLNWLKVIGHPIHKEKIQTFEKANDDYRSLSAKEKKKANKPKKQTLFISGNISTSALIQQLSNNKGFGVIIETEADALNNAMTNEWGSFDDVLRRGFEFETVSMSRKDDENSFEIETPRLSMMLTGTLNQLLTLIPTAENGLFSRFGFMEFPRTKGFGDPFKSTESLKPYYDKIGLKLFKFYKKNKRRCLKVRYSKIQTELMREQFRVHEEKYEFLFGDDIVASIRRYGSIHFRICMLLTGIRQMDDFDTSKPIEVSDIDFGTANKLIEFLLEHLTTIYGYLPKVNDMPKSFTRKVIKLYEALPDMFNYNEFLKIASDMDIPRSTAYGYRNKFLDYELIESIDHGIYEKKSV